MPSSPSGTGEALLPVMRSSLLRRRWGDSPALESCLALFRKLVAISAKLTVLTLSNAIRNRAKKLSLAPCQPAKDLSACSGFKVCQSKIT